jgi:glutathione synthase/RimK-type ligase-like ATP-grasp enzyme
MHFLQKYKWHLGQKKSLSHLQSTQVALGLDAKIVTPRIPPRISPNKIVSVINWGITNCHWLDRVDYSKILNHPSRIANAVDKASALKILMDGGVPVPPFETSRETVNRLFDKEGRRVFCRTLTRASEGRGIVIANSLDQVVPALLYTRYIPKVYEFRVHASSIGPFYIQRKKKLSQEELAARGISPESELIRNSANGYVFSSNLEGIEENIKERVGELGALAVRALQLDFGAVDIITTNKEIMYVLEVNTAPGVEGETVNRYVEMLNTLIHQKIN